MTEQQQRALAAGLEALAATTTSASASARVEDAVMAEFARIPSPQSHARPAASNAVWRAIAAMLMLACASGIWLAQRHTRPAAAAMQQAGFLEIPGTGYLPPLESAAIVRVSLPVTTLPSYGIQIAPDMTTESVDADLLIAQDGLARGIRLVNDLQRSGSTP